MELNNLKPAKGATHHDKRVGRGAGSGHGGLMKLQSITRKISTGKRTRYLTIQN